MFFNTTIFNNLITLYTLEKHPEIKNLMVLDHSFKYVVTLMVLFQFAAISIISHFDLSWTVVFVVTYTVSGTINQALMLSLHEISHNMAFGYAKPMYNKLFSIFVNFPIGASNGIIVQETSHGASQVSRTRVQRHRHSYRV